MIRTWTLIAFSIAMVFSSAEAAGASGSLVTDPSLAFTIPKVAKPGYLAPVVDPTFNTTITRIADNTKHSTAPVAGKWGNDARHVYSKQEPWNATQTLIAVENRGPGATPSGLLLDGTTYQPKAALCSGLYDYRWHPQVAHANEMINVTASGTELQWVDVTTCTVTRSWTLPIAANYGIGSGEGNPSNDGRFVLIVGATNMYVVDMDPQPPYAPYPDVRMGPPLDFTKCGLPKCTVDWGGVSASGKYAVLSQNSDDERVFDIDPATLALTVHGMPAASYRCAGTAANGDIYSLGHADVATNPFDANEDVLIGQEQCAQAGQVVGGTLIGHVLMVRLRDGALTSLTDPTNEAYADHISTRNIDRPGWAYVSYYTEPGKRFSGEVIAVKMDGSGGVERLAHTHGLFKGCYRCEAHPAPSPDGQRVIFASNWAENCARPCGAKSEKKDYVIDTRALR